MTQIALVLRSNEIYAHFSQLPYYNDTYFDELLKSTKTIQDNLQDERSQWDYCSSSQIINRKLVKYWDLDGFESPKKENLFKFVEFILKNVRFIQARSAKTKMEARLKYDKEIMNVLENIIGTRMDQIYQAVDGLVDCEVNRVKVIFGRNLEFLVIGLSVIAFSAVAVFMLLCLSDKYLNLLWIDLFRRCKFQACVIRAAIEDRLRLVHNLEEIVLRDSKIETERVTELYSKKKHSNRFLFLLSIIFLLSVVFIVITTQHFYKDVQSYLEYRPLLLSSIGKRRSHMAGLAFSVVESYSKSENYSINKKIVRFSDIIDSNQLINMKIQELINTGEYINNHKTRPLMSESLNDKIFRFFPDSSPFFLAGADRAADFLEYESYFILSNFANSSMNDISKFMDNANNFNDAYLLIAEQASSDSQRKIEGKIGSMIVFVTLFALLLLGMFITLYYPMLRYEAMVVKWLVETLNLIPSKA